MKRLAAFALGAAFLSSAGFAAEPMLKDQGDRYAGAPHATRSAVLGLNGMAATSQPLATQVALDILKQGGSAVDAAIAANAALGLMEPTGNGIGGDLFAIIWDPKTGKLHGLNASGRAPSGQSLAQLKARISKMPRNAQDRDGTVPDWGALSVTVPGAVDGWFEMHAKFGALPMQRVLAPAIRYAQQGFPVSEIIAAAWASGTANFEVLAKAGAIEEIENMRRVYMPGGAAPKEGAVFRNPDLALTLIEIAEGGRDAFYKGSLAQAMDGYFRRIGAPMRLSDFAAHRSEWVDPVSVNYRGYDVWELPPSGQGIAALQMLNILEGYDLKAMGRASPDFWHVFVEAKKRAFADRARFYADPAFAKIPLAQLLSKDRAAQQRATIDMGAAAKTDMPGLAIEGAGKDTIYLTVADKDGMMVSLIQSNYRGLGSGLVPDDGHGDGQGRTLGFMFQDRGAQFNLDAKHANAYAPGKRPFHTIIPAFLTKDGKPLMSFGLMGGAMQPQGHAQIVVNMVDFGMGVQAAGDAARFHHDGSTDPEGGAPMTDGGVLEIESGVPAAVAEALGTRGHTVRYTTGPFGGYQAIWRDPATGVYRGASEMRKDGQAGGY
ncbi:gamma-glutamyltransferase family protein [Sphingosinicella soli]|uniref:Gamma-glutamyltranspeptidase/glutathione hydrolase n=1 Tax=Sphingosinicella soli TaxID=333708 RepID=A0A7W7B001_9SPHN|nr:gamma-glutamyltransferase family protein [Sphingosinicella soli]MBB4631511.1 gamma-glutamyltranspeptidase/glutathione hydrolase [Sphingosinicella soli]